MTQIFLQRRTKSAARCRQADTRGDAGGDNADGSALSNLSSWKGPAFMTTSVKNFGPASIRC